MKFSMAFFRKVGYDSGDSVKCFRHGWKDFGECCVKCAKKVSGECPGCVEADGAVPEWADSGRCKVHTCVREHGVPFCGLCKEFPCDKLPELISWNPKIIEHLTSLRDEYERRKKS